VYTDLPAGVPFIPAVYSGCSRNNNKLRENSFLYKRIVSFLTANGCCCPVSGINSKIIIQCIKMGPYACFQLFQASPQQICAADSLLKQNIPAKYNLILWKNKTNTSRRKIGRASCRERVRSKEQ